MRSYMGDRADSGDAERMDESGGEPDTKATLFNMSVARPHDCELARALRLALEVVIDGSVADALRSLGRRLLEEEHRGEESLLCILRGSMLAEPIFVDRSALVGIVGGYG